MPEPKDQIPWATHTKVTYQSDISMIALESGTATADVYHHDFEWSISLDSRKMIFDYMTKDEVLTKNIQDFWEAELEKYDGSTYRDRITRWLKGAVGSTTMKKGPKEWRPGVKEPKIYAKLTSYGNTYNDDNYYYWGDVFEYAQFQTDDGDEGAVIIWQRGGDPRGSYGYPEVWIGDFDDFYLSQTEGDPSSYETFLHWNHVFENGFMWAWEKLGLFDDGGEQIRNLDDRLVRGALRAIEHDPSILMPESVEKIVDRFDDFPKELQNAVKFLEQNHRREIEKALGQRLFWENLYAE